MLFHARGLNWRTHPRAHPVRPFLSLARAIACPGWIIIPCHDIHSAIHVREDGYRTGGLGLG